MGARRQGRATTKRTVSTIDELTRVLGSVEMTPVASLRSVPALMDQLTACMGLFELAKDAQAQEIKPLQSIGRQLKPLVEMVAEPDVVAPPFSPDIRQRIGYVTAQLVALRLRLGSSDARIPGKVVRAEAASAYTHLRESWSSFRADPSLQNLEALEHAACHLQLLYRALGMRRSEPRVKGVAKLCDLLVRALDRNGELDDVPALLREVSSKANELCRPTNAEHREWILSIL